MKFFHDQKGFTFMEMLVAVSIFMILVSLVSDIFIQAHRAQKKAATLERLQTDVRFLINRLSNEVSAGMVDYDFYLQNGESTISATSTPELVVRNNEGRRIRFKQGIASDANNCKDMESTPCLLISDTDGASWVRMSSRYVKIETLSFFIKPSVDPFLIGESGVGYQSNTQPHVRIVLRASSQVKGQPIPSHILVQTLATTRKYVR